MTGQADPLVEPFWTSLSEGRLIVQHCRACGALRWPPITGCVECLSRDTEWREVQPSGTVWSFVTYHRAFQSHLAKDIPYTVAMVQLDAGPYLVGRLIGDEPLPSVGDRVIADFTRLKPDHRYLTWRAA